MGPSCLSVNSVRADVIHRMDPAVEIDENRNPRTEAFEPSRREEVPEPKASSASRYNPSWSPLPSQVPNRFDVMGIQGTDFASATPGTTVQQTHLLVLDTHTPTLLSPKSASAIRLRLRDAFHRFLEMLFSTHTTLPTKSSLTLLAVESRTQNVPRLQHVTDTTAARDARHHPSAHTRLRLCARARTIANADIPDYARALVTQIRAWGSAEDVFAFVAPGLGDEIRNVDSTVNVYEGSGEVLDEMLARQLETTVGLALPAADVPCMEVSLIVRPRVISREQPPERLIATKIVALWGLREDIMVGGCWIVWAAGQEGWFDRICEFLREREMGMLCVATVGDSVAQVVLLPGVCEGREVGLLRGVAHAGCLLPVPRLGQRVQSADVVGLEMLEVGMYDGSVRVGVRRGRDGRDGRRVNFS